MALVAGWVAIIEQNEWPLMGGRMGGGGSVGGRVGSSGGWQW